MKLSLLEILEATGGGEVGGTQVGNTFSSFHTDSREVVNGGVFFALRGAEMDGHRFVHDAIKRGATAVVVERRMNVPTGIAEIRVPETWAALYALAAYTLEHVSPLVVAVTGSNGKTSTKEMIAAILGQRFNVLRTSGNLNTETGVPLTMLALQPHHNALVLEMGMQRPGDIGRLVALARPAIGVITNIGTVHMEFFESREELARSKGEMVAGLNEHGTAILNADDQFFPMLVAMTAARVRSFGVVAGDFRAEGYQALEGGGQFSVRGVDVKLGLEGRHQAVNAVAALATGVTAGVTLADGAAALANVAVEHRLQELPTARGYTIVDDAYNASPESMIAAFEALAESPRRGRLLAVLGQMAELGAVSEESHRRVGLRAAEVFDAVCVLDGERARVLAEAAGAELVAGRPAARDWVRRNAREGDRVLVKGSHSTHLDEVVRELTEA
ncbi:MAG TPA: UDP-N-acetylmuramoyl-tripeptide--D-alanyl-D-alanine ligase [Candidatus Acidoferrum sp.]|jgi:UDP-N-acetylmuramoyl-tripeptide--D-alanyl-D-alanine ligase|nr:UDP-N-acetylmuramoyl-tripeptide--D-alanyl-D-alanine ligase [Candidatus Acidoferrum sp.]